MKRVHFDQKLCHLVDEEGKKYKGKRFCKVSTYSNCFSTRKAARDNAKSKLSNIMKEKGADAYEITCLFPHSSGQEYDPHPFSTTLTAILYKC